MIIELFFSHFGVAHDKLSSHNNDVQRLIDAISYFEFGTAPNMLMSMHGYQLCTFFFTALDFLPENKRIG